MKETELGELSIKDFEVGGWYNPIPIEDSELKWLIEDKDKDKK